jgi:peptide/nickel transport system ATP-binding protein/oligopeptide transport system ATP-binding protein
MADRPVVYEVRDLHVEIPGRAGLVEVLRGISFDVRQGEVFGLIGETGAGKSLTAWASVGMLQPPVRVSRGEILLDGIDLLRLKDAAMNATRGSKLGLIVQNPTVSLDPTRRISAQIERVIRRHQDVSRSGARRRAGEALRAVGVIGREDAYPHELSGGLAQRAMIALAMVNAPRLLIADEPTTGLDATVQLQVLDTLADLARREQSSVLLITHDLGVVAQYCQRVAVMRDGTIVEQGAVADVFVEPKHGYTQQLLAAAGSTHRPEAAE